MPTSKKTTAKAEETKEPAAKTEKSPEEQARAARVELYKRKAKAAQGSADNGYLPKTAERHLVHARISKPLFNSKTGKDMSQKRIQIFTPKAWKGFKANSGSLGFTVEVLWNPEAYKETN